MAGNAILSDEMPSQETLECLTRNARRMLSKGTKFELIVGQRQIEDKLFYMAQWKSPPGQDEVVFIV